MSHQASITCARALIAAAAVIIVSPALSRTIVGNSLICCQHLLTGRMS